ncbi:MAG: type II secretion system protein GspL [Rehaibacterium terrae]|uniref:type II secretion system protein GspL n=1 Tax=Rehaibacterium terrae TaxID=1341696 RepID=UPI00391B4437
MPRLLVRLLPDGRAAWLALDRDGRPAGAVGAGLPPAGGQDQIIAIAPAEDVLLLGAPRVARSEKQLAQALPYAIEDRLAMPVETQHVAWAPTADPARLRVAVIARERLDTLLATLRAAGLEPDVLVPEPLLLPVGGLLAEPGRVLLRSGETSALALTPEELPAFLPAGPVEAILAAGAQADLPANVTTRRVDDALHAYAAALTGAIPLDLLQGDYAPRRRREGAARAWRHAALAAGVAVALGIVHLAVERQQLAAHVQAQREEMAQLLRAAVPGTQRIVDPAQQLRAALASSGEGGGDAALGLLAAAAPALSVDAATALDALDYRDGVLELTVTAPDVAALDALRARLAAAALRVELTAATPGSRGVEGRLRIRGDA